MSLDFCWASYYICSFSQKVLVSVQTFFTYVFGALTLLVITILITNTDWNALFL